MRIYIYAPYRASDSGERAINVLRAIEVAERLAKHGFWNTFIPHLYHYWNQKYEHPNDFWMKKCLEEVRRSDFLVGCGKTSEGCDMEIEEARVRGIPVYKTAKEFLADYNVAAEYARKNFGIGA
jgi:hypothetical protein